MIDTQDIETTIFISGEVLHLVGCEGSVIHVPLDTTFLAHSDTRAVIESVPSAPRAVCLLRRPVGTRFANGETRGSRKGLFSVSTLRK